MYSAFRFCAWWLSLWGSFGLACLLVLRPHHDSVRLQAVGVQLAMGAAPPECPACTWLLCNQAHASHRGMETWAWRVDRIDGWPGSLIVFVRHVPLAPTHAWWSMSWGHGSLGGRAKTLKWPWLGRASFNDPVHTGGILLLRAIHSAAAGWESGVRQRGAHVWGQNMWGAESANKVICDCTHAACSSEGGCGWECLLAPRCAAEVVGITRCRSRTPTGQNAKAAGNSSATPIVWVRAV